MLYFLHTLDSSIPLFNLMGYITVRSGIAVTLSFLITLFFAPKFIRMLQRMRVIEDTTKSDSDALNEMHEGKKFTPTMGGIILLAAVLGSAFVCCNFSVVYIWLSLFVIVAMGAIGFIDDFVKLRTKKPGLSAKAKYALQMVVVLIPAFYLVNKTGLPYASADGGTLEFSTLIFPFVKEWMLPLGALYAAWVVLVMTGTTNAVNLTDGLDGLATGCSITVCLVYAIICYLVGRVDFSEYLFVPYVEGAGEMTVLLSAFLGALIGFMWFNGHPAEIFMGDTGSLTIGGVLGMAALVSKHEILLIIAGGVFFFEALSVILQVGSFKLTGKRIFRIAPFHHHLQFMGWPETKVVIRLWIISLVLAFIALATLKIR